MLLIFLSFGSNSFVTFNVSFLTFLMIFLTLKFALFKKIVRSLYPRTACYWPKFQNGRKRCSCRIMHVFPLCLIDLLLLWRCEIIWCQNQRVFAQFYHIYGAWLDQSCLKCAMWPNQALAMNHLPWPAFDLLDERGRRQHIVLACRKTAIRREAQIFSCFSLNLRLQCF